MKEACLGQPVVRVDGHAKVTGAASYTADVPLPDLVHAVIVGSTIAKGFVAGVDARAAEVSPGVLRVLAWPNAPKLPGAAIMTGGDDRVVQVLQDNRVRYDGQPVALVIAETLEAARRGASLVAVRYERGTPIVEMERELDAAFVPRLTDTNELLDSHRGNVDAALETAPVRIEGTYRTPVENHSPIELHATTVTWEAHDRLVVYDTTQDVSGVQQRLARMFGIPRENVRVISRFLGGSFGTKGSVWSQVVLAAMAARVVGRPVKIVITRQQAFAFVGHRPPTMQRVALGARADGSLVVIRHDVVSWTSRFDGFVETSAFVTRMLYACPNVATSHRLVRLDVSTPTFMRAPGEATGSFALESAMDELAWATGIDPLALRLTNYAERDPETDRPWSSKSLRECYELGAERFGWSRRERATRAMRDGQALVGWGMATATHPTYQSPASAIARLLADGSVLVQSGSHDLGTGTYTVMTQVAADALAMPISRVRFELGDTNLPPAPIAAYSQTTASVGSAVQRAAVALRTMLAEVASADPRSPLYGLAVDKIDAENGSLVAASDRSKSDAYADIVRRHGSEIAVRARVDPKAERERWAIHEFGAHFVEVRVDEDLGQVRVSRVVSAIAAGKILNTRTARSQVIGAIVGGIGLALHEQTVRDARDGRLVTKDLGDYHVPVNADVPDIDVILVPEVDEHANALGVKGIGEVGIVGVGGAIANAVYHATGRRIRDLPITPDKLL